MLQIDYGAKEGPLVLFGSILDGTCVFAGWPGTRPESGVTLLGFVRGGSTRVMLTAAEFVEHPQLAVGLHIRMKNRRGRVWSSRAVVREVSGAASREQIEQVMAWRLGRLSAAEAEPEETIALVGFDYGSGFWTVTAHGDRIEAWKSRKTRVKRLDGFVDGYRAEEIVLSAAEFVRAPDRALGLYAVIGGWASGSPVVAVKGGVL